MLYPAIVGGQDYGVAGFEQITGNSDVGVTAYSTTQSDLDQQGKSAPATPLPYVRVSSAHDKLPISLRVVELEVRHVFQKLSSFIVIVGRILR